MSIINRISERSYRDLALREPDMSWELWDGEPRTKPLMSKAHGDVMAFLAVLLQNQLGRREHRVRVNHARLRVDAQRYFIPDVAVIPVSLQASSWGDPQALDAFAEPLPLVVEIWSPSTGEYDIETKLGGYQERGDLEIWRVHPYEPLLTAWRRQSDGRYEVASYGGGRAAVASLPDVVIDLDELLAP